MAPRRGPQGLTGPPGQLDLAGAARGPAGVGANGRLLDHGIVLAQAPTSPSPGPKTGGAAAKGIKERPDLFFDPAESTTFARFWSKAIRLGITVLPVAGMNASDAAQYDKINNTIRLSAAEYAKPKDPAKTRRSTAHEMFHGVQNEPILKKAPTPVARAKAIDAERLAMTEDQFVAYTWKRELQAEAFAWTCDGEALNHFQTQRGGAPFDAAFLKSVVSIRVGEFAKSKPKYVKSARKTWRALARRHGKIK